jgi:hypothetical protein
MYDPSGKFALAANVLLLADTVLLSDIAYSIKIRATDSNGNTYDQVFAIYVLDAAPPAAVEVGEINIFDQALSVLTGAQATITNFTVPADRIFRVNIIDCFGYNTGIFEVEIDGVLVAKKGTFSTYYETSFDLDNLEITAGQNLTVKVINTGATTAEFNSRLKGYQYVG